MLGKWDLRFVELCKHISQWSKDPSTKVGSVIVDQHRRVVGMGYNGFPRGVIDAPTRYEEKAVKYRMVVHAEANAILNAVICDLTGFSLYVTKYPCSECTKLIVQRGIANVYSPPADNNNAVWGQDSEFSKVMLLESGTRHHEFVP